MSALRIHKLAGALGAEISGVDLAGDLPEALIEVIRGALVEHQVIFFRDQQLTPEQQERFLRQSEPL